MLFHDEKALLFCMHCQKETPHNVHYVNQTISSIECETCHNEMGIDVDVMQEFHHYLYERLTSKPGRMTEEARQDLSHFLATLPMRLVSKPIRFSSEYSQMNKEVKHFIEESQSTQADDRFEDE